MLEKLAQQLLILIIDILCGQSYKDRNSLEVLSTMCINIGDTEANAIDISIWEASISLWWKMKKESKVN